MFELKGKTALITGAGQGVGFGIAQALSQQGAAVVINDVCAERAQQAADSISADGGTAIACAFDVTDLDQVTSSVQALPKTIDILVNNAGNAGDGEMEMIPFVDMDPQQWQRFVNVNLFGVLNCTKAVLATMYKQKWGRIITVSSDAGRVGLDINVSLYGAAKAGAAHFMRHLAVEAGPFGVTCNILSLGLMNNVPEEFAGPIIKGIPARRLGDPMDIGHACVYLSSEEASWTSGATLQITGGKNPT